MFCLWHEIQHSHRFTAHLFCIIFCLSVGAVSSFTFKYVWVSYRSEVISRFSVSQLFPFIVYAKWITFSLSFSSFRRYFDRYKERLFNGRCSKWSIADDIRDIVHGVCTDLRLPGRSVFATMDHDLRRGTVERHNADWLIHAVVSVVHGIPGVSRCRRGIV